MDIFPDLEELFRKSKYVQIDNKALQSFTTELLNINDKFDANSLLSFASDRSLEERLQLSFFFNTQTFYFWAQENEPKWAIDYKDKSYDGSVALAKCFERSMERTNDVFDAKYFNDLDISKTEEFFKGNVQIPLLAKRVQMFNEGGYVLLQKFNGQYSNVVEKSGYDALRLLRLIIDNFSYYNDQTYYHSTLLNFHKRAQLQVIMTHNLLETSKKKGLKNIESLIGCADYKLPQILRHFGVLEYDGELSGIVDSHTLIDEYSEYEVEIRIGMLVCLKKISEELRNHGSDVPPILLDGKLWRMSQTVENMKPYHKTITINY